MKPGYNGHEPVFAPARDIHGKGKRERIDSVQNDNSDRVMFLHSRGIITNEQKLAAERLQRAHETSSTIPCAIAGNGSGPRHEFTPADARLNAAEDYRLAMKALGARPGAFVHMVVCEGKQVVSVGKAFGMANEQRSMGAFLMALDVLVAHYG